LAVSVTVAPPDLPLDTWFLGRADVKTSGMVRINNLYWGGAHPNIPGIGDLKADPRFTGSGDFHLQSNSSALRAGRWTARSRWGHSNANLHPTIK